MAPRQKGQGPVLLHHTHPDLMCYSDKTVVYLLFFLLPFCSIMSCIRPHRRLYARIAIRNVLLQLMLNSEMTAQHVPYVQWAQHREISWRHQELSLLFMLLPSLEQLLSGRCLRIEKLKYPSWNLSSCLSVPTVSRLQVFYGSSWKLFPMHYQNPVKINNITSAVCSHQNILNSKTSF